MLVHLVDGGVDRTQLHHLSAGGGDKAAVTGAAGGGQMRVGAGAFLDRRHGGVHQGAAVGEERLAGQLPLDLVIQAVALQDGFGALAQFEIGDFGGKAEIEQHLAITGNHIGGAGAGVDVGDLKAGGREEIIAPVPFRRRQFRQGRCHFVHRIAGQMRVGHVPLHAFYREQAAQGAAPTVLDHVPHRVRGGGLAHQAVVDVFVAFLQGLHHLDGAVH